MIHRDLKPSNILVDGAGAPHVLDFGLARLVAPCGDGRPAVTRSGQVMGTPAYASPEHVRGRAADVDVRSDLYALGVILYELLCGRLPYPVDGSLADIFESIERREPAPPSRTDPRLDRELDAIVLQALDKDPERRYASVEALAEDLDRYLRGRPVQARGRSVTYLVKKTVRRHRVPVAIAALLLAVACGYMVLMPVLYARCST